MIEFPLVASSSRWLNLLNRSVVFVKVSLLAGSLLWRYVNSGFIPDAIAAMLYLILLGFGVSILFL